MSVTLRAYKRKAVPARVTYYFVKKKLVRVVVLKGYEKA